MTAAPPHLAMIGASARPLLVEGLAAEFSITVDDARAFLAALDVPTTMIGPHEWADLFAVESAWHRKMNPDLWRDGSAVEIIREIGHIYEGAVRSALLVRLHEFGNALFPEISRRKRDRARYHRDRRRRRGPQDPG